MDVYIHASFLQFSTPDLNFPRSYWYVQGESWIEQLGNPSLEQIESSSRDKAPREHPSSWRSRSFPRVYSSLSERGLRSVGEGTNHSFLFKSSTLVFFNNIGFVKWYMIMIQTNHTTEKRSPGSKSLSHTAHSHWLLYMWQCVCFHAALLPPCPQVSSLSASPQLPAHTFISTIFLDSTCIS